MVKTRSTQMINEIQDITPPDLISKNICAKNKINIYH